MTRRYSEEEAQRIFALVAERQRVTQGADRGLSLAELEEAARAAGLDRTLVASAAAEMDAAPGPDATLGGALVEVVRQRMVPNALSDDAWAQMVAVMRREVGEAGVAGQVGRLREWTLMSAGKNGTVTRLTAEPTADGTRITITQSVREMVKGLSIAQAIQASMATLFAGLALFGVDGALWIPAAILFGLSLLFAVGTHVGTRLWHRQQSARFERLLDRLELTARDDAPDPLAVAEPSALTGGLLDLDALPDPPETEASSAQRRERV